MADAEAMAARTKLGIDEKGLCNQPENAAKKSAFFAASAVDRREARNMCGSYGKENACPVREECLKWALENKEIWGVWGGLDESELRRILWVDSVGHQKPRCRFPNCPNCKARPNKLRVIQELDSSIPTVTCVRCDFSWKSRTSALAVKAYQRERRRRQVQAHVPRRRIMDPSVTGGASIVALPIAVRDDGDPFSLVASGDQ